MTTDNKTQTNQAQDGQTAQAQKKNDEFFVDTKGPQEYQVTPIMSFDKMGLKPALLRGIYGKGFSQPSGIQKLGIKPIIEKKDLLAQAQSGSGKTGTFLIGALQNIDDECKD